MQFTAIVNSTGAVERLHSTIPKLAPDLEAIAKAGADVIENEAKWFVPIRTMRLYESIQQIIVEHTDQKVVINVMPEAVYAEMVSHGESRTHRPSKFMEKALRSGKDLAREAMVKALREAIARS